MITEGRSSETDPTNSQEPETVPSYVDISGLHPLLEDFTEVSKNKKSFFPYKWIAYDGNYWDTVARVIRPRGYNLIQTKDDDKLDNINFIWKPTQFSFQVKEFIIISIMRKLTK